MSEKSGISDQVISLPEGGGALSGIGEKFSPDLFTGTGNFTVPISLPSGRNGFQPNLDLVYSTGNGNGPFGLGWNLSVPGVSRQTSKGIPRYRDYGDRDQRDTFVLSGAEDLVPVDESTEEGWARYRPRTEGLFARITHHFGGGANYWKVESKDGLVSIYGTHPDDLEVENGTREPDPAIIADPVDRGRIFNWKLTKTTDPFGNEIRYSYRRDTDETDGHHWDQLYLEEIKYVEYDDPEANGDTAKEPFLIWIIFDYGDAERPDPFSAYRSGFEIRTRLRCEEIRIETRPKQADRAAFYGLDAADPDLSKHILARTIELTYSHEPYNGVSLLEQIQVTGHDVSKANTQKLPPLAFSYTVFDPDGRDFYPLDGELPRRSLANADLELVDLFGNALPDIVQMNGAVRYWRNRGAGCFDLPQSMASAPAGLKLDDPGVQLIDADGNGRIDLLVTQDGLSGYFPLRYGSERDGAGWDHRSFQRYETAPSFNLEDPQVQLVDLTGDGVTDVIRSGSRLECYFNDPQDGWGEMLWVEREHDLALFPNVHFLDPRVRWGDMSGDGMQDILLIHDGNVEYWPNLGYGRWGARIGMARSPRFPYGYDPQRILVGDVDGDGLADIVYVEDTQVTLWINQSGNGWSAPKTVEGTPPVSDMDAVRLVDMLGSGVSGIMWTRDTGAYDRTHYFFLDFTDGVKPYLLAEINNHMGAVTRVLYRPSTYYYQVDAQRPETRWRTPLPFPVQVVAQVEVIDAISQGKLTTEYRYHHGYWDGAEREFRGFGLVEQLDTETFDSYHARGLHGENVDFAGVAEGHYSPPMLTKTWFHQGPVGEAYGDWEAVDWTESDWSCPERMVGNYCLDLPFYWPGDPPLLDHTGKINNFLAALPQRRARRDALRAMRGRILRTELYALDGDKERQERPYTVTEHAYGLCAVVEDDEATPGSGKARLLCDVRELEDGGPGEERSVFFPHTVTQRVTQWERGDDPMTQFNFAADYDDFGQPTRQTAVAMPRRRDYWQNITGAVVGELTGEEINETRILAMHTHTEYAVSHAERFMHNRVAQTWLYELKDPPGVSLSETEWEAATGVCDRLLQPDEVRLIAHTINHYDGHAYEGLPVGELGPYGALTRSETLVFTDHELDEAYGERRPAYLDGSAALPGGAPEGFGEALGYRRSAPAPDDTHDRYYADSQRQCFDFQVEGEEGQARGIVRGIEDALGHRATIEPDPYWLLPAKVSDPVALITTAEYDYRVLQTKSVTDPNDNTIYFRYTPLGLLDRQFLAGREGEGGNEEQPEIAFAYDLLAYAEPSDTENPQPVHVHTKRRVYHASQSISDETIESREYSDGFGRLLQTRIQAEELIFGETGDDVGLPPEAGSEPDTAVGRRESDSVVVSGWQIYDNKGQVIEKYEPFFDVGWAYEPQEEAERGQHITMYYDPRGQVIRTVNPDGSQQRVIYGVPGSIDDPDLSDPDVYEPTPWEAYAYDGNDNAERTHPGKAAAAGWEHHLDTPASILIDGLGRTILSVARNRHAAEDAADPAELYLTRSRYDVRSNLLLVIDAHGRDAFSYAYDLRNQTLRIDNIDAGQRTSVLDANGNLVEYRDSKGSIVLRRYDALNRLTELWARDNDEVGSRLTLRERLIYGDQIDRAMAKAANALGQLVTHYDEAGVQHFAAYDFKGNLTEKVRQVIGDRAIAAGWTAAWDASDAEDALDPTAYETSTRYDALNRPMQLTYPRDVAGMRSILTQHYNRAGALEAVELDGDPYVTQLAYNARGQRVLIAYGNGVMTRYAYDTETFQLARMRSERCADVRPAGDTWVGEGGRTNPRTLFQDFGYQYDLSGNITVIDHHAPCSGIRDSWHGRDRLLRRFSYDAVYRLTSATGRACAAIDVPRPLTDLRRSGYIDTYIGGAPTTNVSNAPELTQAYTESYNYDPMGNMLKLGYTAGSRNWVRRFGMDENDHADWAAAGSNQMTSLAQGGMTHSFTYDANGNMIQQNSERHHMWDHADRMIGFANRPEGAEHVSVEACYLYGADGKRVKKWVQTNGTNEGESTVYIADTFESHVTNNGLTVCRLHVMDSLSQPTSNYPQRIALVCRVEQSSGNVKSVGYHYLADHLGNSQVVISGQGNHIICEEYFAYGETSYGGTTSNRYRFTGKERDACSGLMYFGVRYYSPPLTRWLSVDPYLLRGQCSSHNDEIIKPGPITNAPTIITQGVQSGKPINEGEKSILSIQKAAIDGWVHEIDRIQNSKSNIGAVPKNRFVRSYFEFFVPESRWIDHSLFSRGSYNYVSNRPIVAVDPNGSLGFLGWVAIIVVVAIVAEHAAIGIAYRGDGSEDEEEHESHESHEPDPHDPEDHPRTQPRDPLLPVSPQEEEQRRRQEEERRRQEQERTRRAERYEGHRRVPISRSRRGLGGPAPSSRSTVPRGRGGNRFR